MPTDAELLFSFAKAHDEAAFTQLVQRHLGLVYGAALRRTNGRHALAEEITQRVFIDLARKASRLIAHETLTGWLYRSTRYAAIDALRAEQRREKLTQSLAAMHDETSPEETGAEWKQLWPVLDEALDQLKERDREILLLRFFQNRSFAEIGAQLGLTENTARMRTERALEKLRAPLSRRGVTSTAAALLGVFGANSLSAAPAGLASTVSTTALAYSATGIATGLITFFMSSKIIAPATSAILAALFTAGVWQAVPTSVSAEELASLRSENERLNHLARLEALPDHVQAIAIAATNRSAARGRQHAQQATATVSPSAAPSNKFAPSARGHVFRGLNTPLDASSSFAYACDAADVDLISRLMWFEPGVREQAMAKLADAPASIREQYPTPELYYALLCAADSLIYPPPAPEVVGEMHSVELIDGRAVLRKKGSDRNIYEFQKTSEGWKFVMPAVGVEHLPKNLNNELWLRLGRQASQP